VRSATNLAQLCEVEKIRSGKYQLPNDKLLKKSAPAPASGDSFMDIPATAGEEEELPF
jgi:hypothetical protein